MQISEKPKQQRRTSIEFKPITSLMIENFKLFIQNALNDSTNFLFNQSHYIVFETILQHFPYDKHKTIRQVINSPLLFKIQTEDKEIKESMIKVLFLIVAFFSYNENLCSSFFDTKENSLMIHFIRKLYQNSLIELEGISLFITFGIDFSLYSTTSTKPLLNQKLLLFIINVFVAIIKGSNTLLSNSMVVFAKNILNYIDNNMFINANNIYVLRKNNHFLRLLTITYFFSFNELNIKQLILDLLFKIYKHSYNDVLNRRFISNCKNAFSNIKNKPMKKIEKEINTLRTQIELISKLIKQESIDKTILHAGFIFNDTQSNGLTITEFAPSIKNFTILFSFLQEELQVNSEAPLFSFCNNIKEDRKSMALNEKVIFSVIIVNRRLIIQFDQTSYVMQAEEIKLNKTYFVYLSSSRNRWGSSNTIDIGINNKFEKVEIKGKFDRVDILMIGHSINKNSKTNFKGKIGPILFYDSLLEEKAKQCFFRLYNQYDKAIFDSKTNFSFDESQKYQSADSDMLSALDQFQLNKVLESLKIVIHPSIVLNAFKLNQHYRFFCNNEYNRNKKSDFSLEKECKFKCNPIPEHFSTYPFINLSSIAQFLKYEGINFLILNIEYFYTIIHSIEKEDSIKMLNSMYIYTYINYF